MMTVYKQQKQQENEQALKLLSARLAEVDEMSHDEQCLELVKGVLGGNVFDWGAKEVAALMESSQFGFSHALDILQGTLFSFFKLLSLLLVSLFCIISKK